MSWDEFQTRAGQEAGKRFDLARYRLGLGPGTNGVPDPPPCVSEDADQLEEPSGLDRARSQVVSLLGPTPTKVDDLMRRCQLSPAAVMAVLLELELAGRVETLPGNRFALLTEAGS